MSASGDPEFEAWGAALSLCIMGCRCPTCGAPSDALCKSSSGKIVPSHTTRTKAGHALMHKTAEEMGAALIKDQMQKMGLTQP